ncbi:hypothetical protein D3C80_1491090 [compost metagenome]
MQGRVEQVVGVHALQGHGDRLDAAGDDDLAATRGDLVGGDGDGLQTRRTEAVEGHAGDLGAQAGEHRHIAADVEALGAFVGAGTNDAVFDQRRIQVATRQQRIHAMSRHIVRTGLVELATEGFGQASPHAIDNHHFTHDAPQLLTLDRPRE